MLGIEDLHPPTIRGTMRDPQADTVPNTTITLFRDPTGSDPVARRVDDTTTDKDGRFELPLTEVPLDGYFEMTVPAYLHTFSHLIKPVVTEHEDPEEHEIITLNAQGLRRLASDISTTQDPTAWLVLAKVIDADGTPLPGATVHAEVGDPPVAVQLICYTTEDTGLPCHTGTTTSDGRAWLFNIPETSSLTITAVDAAGHPHTISFPIVAGPGVVSTPVPPP